MEKSTKKFRNLGSDRHDVSMNHCIFNFKFHLRADIAGTAATAIARISVIYQSIALFFLYRMVYVSIMLGPCGGRCGGKCEKV